MSTIFINPYRYDPDAEDYINRVIAADIAAGDTSGLEVGVQDAINAFFVGCKTDGIRDAIKASCILAGARTLDGALVPLVGTAPTNYNFVSGDYNRETGLNGDGSTKYLDSGYMPGQNNNHLSIFASSLAAGEANRLAGVANAIGTTALFIAQNTSPERIRSRNFTSSDDYFYTGLPTGFIGISRSSSASYLQRTASTTTSASATSGGISTSSVTIFAENRQGGTVVGFPTSRIAFYSIGESLDLALLDARVTTLMSDLAAAIP